MLGATATRCPGRSVVTACAGLKHAADELVPENGAVGRRMPGRRLQDVQVSAADPAAFDRKQDIGRQRNARDGPLLEFENTFAREHRGEHRGHAVGHGQTQNPRERMKWRLRAALAAGVPSEGRTSCSTTAQPENPARSSASRTAAKRTDPCPSSQKTP